MNDPDRFREQVDTIFRVDHDSGPIQLRLVEVADGPAGGGFQRFSLLFHGPADRVLPQGTYDFHHDALGSLMVFIVPVIGSNAERIVYEAVFSRPMAAPPAP